MVKQAILAQRRELNRGIPQNSHQSRYDRSFHSSGSALNSKDV